MNIFKEKLQNGIETTTCEYHATLANHCVIDGYINRLMYTVNNSLNKSNLYSSSLIHVCHLKT